MQTDTHPAKEVNKKRRGEGEPFVSLTHFPFIFFFFNQLQISVCNLGQQSDKHLFNSYLV